MSGTPAQMTSWRLNDDRLAYSREKIEIGSVLVEAKRDSSPAAAGSE